jgi:ribonuclease HI
VVKYESLLIGLEIEKDMEIKILNIKGDSDLVILQVKKKYVCKSERLKRYINIIWDTMEWFSAIDLISIPREHNNLVDKLAISNSTFQRSDKLLNGQGKMEINFKPSVPDNIDHWRVFKDDRQILNFIHNVQELSSFNVSYKE